MGQPAISWELVDQDGGARRGRLHTPHGAVATPAFMPVGTRGTVKAVDTNDLEASGAQMILANTYHLMLRPGADTVAELGELHGFMAWNGPILTDSGGYQIFSLRPEITEEGAVFRSTYDGSVVELTPERAIAIQERLGADIAMVLDVLVGLPAERDVLISAMERTLRWSERAIEAKRRTDRALFGIVQGGTDPELRAESARRTAALSFPGFGIGGLSVGESPTARNRALSAAVAELPASKVRYVMGLGDTEGILDAVERGADLFDCVLPTRLARHGKALHRYGDFSIKRSEWAASTAPIDPQCACLACRRYSRGHLRHLFNTRESLGPRLLTLHNLRYTADLMANIRHAIGSGSFATTKAAIVAARASGRA